MVPHYYNYDLMKHINVIRRTDPAISSLDQGKSFLINFRSYIKNILFYDML